MDPDSLRLLLARAPGLTAGELRSVAPTLAQVPALIGTGAGARGLSNLPAAARRWFEVPDQTLLAADLAFIRRERVQLIDCFDPGYPALLAAIADAPPVLFVLGSAAALRAPQLAIVGTRNPTPGGARTAAQFAAQLVRQGLVITSGLALGIDAAAHTGALAGGGRTVAVLGTGPDRVYPPEHGPLRARIIASGGALITQFPPGAPPRREHFPHRNRLISGLALGTLVVEAARYSGSLVTARLAAEQGREVFAIPGSIHNLMARGCHALIRNGAKLVEGVEDVLAEIQFPVSEQSITAPQHSPVTAPAAAAGLDNDYKILLDAMGFEPTGIDALVGRTGLPSQSVASMLLILELEGRVGVHTGGRYMRLDQERDG